jgi:hypothetical protein
VVRRFKKPTNKPYFGHGAALGLTALMLVVASCQIPNIDEVKVDEPFVVDYSLPLGIIELNVDDMVKTTGSVPVDIGNIPPGTNLFLFGGNYYKTPAVYDTLVSFEFDLSATEQYFDNIRYFTFRLNMINSSHATVKLQLYLRGDDTNNPIDSIFAKGPFDIKAGLLDKNNKVIPEEIWRHDETFTNERVLKLGTVTHLDAKVKLTFPSIPLPPVDYQSNDLLWNQLGAKTGLTIKPDEL